MVDRLALQPERAGQDKIKGEALGLDLGIGAQLQLDGIALGPEQGVFHIPGKAVLAALVGLAVCGKGAACQLAGPGEENGRVALPDGRVSLPEHLFPRRVFQADGLCAVGVHCQGQKLIMDGCLHGHALLLHNIFCAQYTPFGAKSQGEKRTWKCRKENSKTFAKWVAKSSPA